MKTFRYLVIATISLLILAGTQATAFAQLDLIEVLSGNKSTEEKASLKDLIIQKKENLAKEITQFQIEFDEASVDPTSLRYNQLKAQKDLLEELRLYFEQITESIGRQGEIAEEEKTLNQELVLWNQDTPPQVFTPSFEQLDNLSDQIHLEMDRINASLNTQETLEKIPK